ncbi:MAG TPA: 50S ribosomal protein L11 methyltransferase [Solirubrobacterales bacterium]
MTDDELVTQAVELPNGELPVLQPREAAELPDMGEIKWAPIAPYWSVLWRSGVALAAELEGADLRGRRVVELGCGLAVPSLAAARAGATVLATDADPEALALVERNADANGVAVETAVAEFYSPGELVDRGPFELALAADVLYLPSSIDPLLELLPRLAPEAWLADPGRADAASFLGKAAKRWAIETSERGVVAIHKLRLR